MPAGRDVVEKLAVPLSSDSVARTVDPLMNVTVPVAAAASGTATSPLGNELPANTSTVKVIVSTPVAAMTEVSRLTVVTVLPATCGDAVLFPCERLVLPGA